MVLTHSSFELGIRPIQKTVDMATCICSIDVIGRIPPRSTRGHRLAFMKGEEGKKGVRISISVHHTRTCRTLYDQEGYYKTIDYVEFQRTAF